MRTLHSLSGWATTALTWDSTGAPAGDYYLDVTLLDAKGHTLDRVLEEFTLGITAGEVTALQVSPQVFTVGGTHALSLTFHNTGTVPISGTVFIRVQDTTWSSPTATFTHTLASLAPGSEIIFNDLWDTSGLAEDSYRVIGYVNYHGTVSNAIKVMVGTSVRVYLPLILKSGP